MQEVLPAHRPEFPSAEEPGHRDLAQGLRQQPGVVVGFGEHPRAAAGAGEQQRPGRLAGCPGPRLPAPGRGAGPHWPNGRPARGTARSGPPELAAHRDGSRVGIGAGDAADQEVSLAGFGPELVDDDTQVRAAGEQLLLPARQRRGQFPQPRQRRPPGQLDDQVAVGAGDDVRVPDRAASLRHQRTDPGPRQVSADGAVGDHPVVQEQQALPGPQRDARHPAHHRGPRHVLVQMGQQVTGRERERVAHHQVNPGREPVAAERAAARGLDELHGERLDRAEVGGEPEGNRGSGLDLAGAARHGLRDASDQRHAAGLFGHGRHQGRGRGGEMRGGEQHGERWRLRPQRCPGIGHGLARRRLGVRGLDEGSSGLHQTRLPGWLQAVPGAGTAARSGYQAWTIEVPCTLMLTGAAGTRPGR